MDLMNASIQSQVTAIMRKVLFINKIIMYNEEGNKNGSGR